MYASVLPKKRFTVLHGCILNKIFHHSLLLILFLWRNKVTQSKLPEVGHFLSQQQQEAPVVAETVRGQVKEQEIPLQRKASFSLQSPAPLLPLQPLSPPS